MKYMVFGDEKSAYPVAILTRFLRQQELQGYLGDQVAADTVAYNMDTLPKAKNAAIKEYLAKLLPVLCGLQVEYLLITDANYFKVLTKTQRVDRIGGYVLPCVLEGFRHFNVIYLPSPAQMIYDPSLMHKKNQGLHALAQHRANTYLPPGLDIVKFSEHPTELADIQAWLDKLLYMPLACDIEAYSLKHYKAGIGTIAFAWSQHEGISFAVDKDNPPAKRLAIRAMLKKFFEERAAQTIYHNLSYDVTVLIYQLFMDNLLDTEGMLRGLEIMMYNWDDSLLLTYLATNSCTGNKLGLKDQAQEFAGNYMVDVKDISVVPLPELLTYNLVDSLATWYVYNKHLPTVHADQQFEQPELAVGIHPHRRAREARVAEGLGRHGAAHAPEVGLAVVAGHAAEHERSSSSWARRPGEMPERAGSGPRRGRSRGPARTASSPTARAAPPSRGRG